MRCIIHTAPPPRKGEIVLFVASREERYAEVVDVMHFRDPNDMFELTLEDVRF